jgi:hypothetical protein
MVIQGATHTWGKRVDRLHEEVTDLCRNFGEEDEENGGGTTDENGTKAKRKTRATDFTDIFSVDDYTFPMMKDEDQVISKFYLLFLFNSGVEFSFL